MNLYRKKIASIFNEHPDLQNERPGIRWAFQPIKRKTKYLVLGINPSNSVTKVNSVINKSGSRWSDGPFMDQYDYDTFLSDPNNAPKILLLQDLAHKHHPHFKKHRYFAEKLGLQTEDYQFFDLFPIWRIKQKDFIQELKSEQKRSSIDAFIDLLDRHSQLKGLLFFNSTAAKFFMQERHFNWHLKEKVNVRKADDIRGARHSLAKKGEIKLSFRNIHVHCLGIGGYFGKPEMEKLGQAWGKHLSN